MTLVSFFILLRFFAMISGTRPICDTMESTEKIGQLWKLLSLDLEKIGHRSGCYPRCTLNHYKPKTLNKATNPVGTRMLSLTLKPAVVSVWTEKAFYDGYNLIADVGGNFGLLLGLSVLDILKTLIEGLGPAIKKFL